MMDNIHADIERAKLLLERGRMNEALQAAKQVLQGDPNNTDALTILAQCHLGNKDYEEAISIIQTTLSIEPNNDFLFYLLAFTYYQKDEYFAGHQQITEAIRINPYYSGYYGLQANIYLAEKEYEEALRSADEGLAIDPEDVTCLNARSRALSKLRRTSEAIETMENTLEQDPENEATHVTVGWNYLERGEHKKANEHFRQALRLSPDNEAARIGLKESLKANFLPYKLVFQFGLWMAEKSKNFRWFFLIGIYVIIRLINSVAKENEALRPFLFPIVVIYGLFVFFTWIATPIANFFLLFHKEGKYAITKFEGMISVTVLLLLCTGISLAAYVYYSGAGTDGALFYNSLILATMAIPVAQLELPERGDKWEAKTWYPLALLGSGTLSIIFSFFFSEVAFLFAALYAIGLLIFTWVANSWE